MKVLALTRYEDLGASSRMRTLQYLPWLESAGLEVTTAPLFSNAYVAELQNGRRHTRDVLRAYCRRLAMIPRTGNYNLIWIEKECLPWLPSWIELGFLSPRVPYVLDYDDAVFHSYDQHSQRLVRGLLAGKHPALMREAALVVAGNAYLAEIARNSGAPRTEILPTAVDLMRYGKVDSSVFGDDRLAPCIGWIGQRATADYLRPLAPLFRQLSSQGSGRFAAIGIDTESLGLPMSSIPWNEQTEVASMRSFDIGIMPLADGPFERGKCGYKLIQYMACGLPVVASPVGVNCQLVEHGVNGFLADTPADWKAALETLLGDAVLRKRMGQAGRQKIEREYCIQVTGPRLVKLLADVASAH